MKIFGKEKEIRQNAKKKKTSGKPEVFFVPITKKINFNGYRRVAEKGNITRRRRVETLEARSIN